MGDELAAPDGSVRVRSLQTLTEPVSEARGVARVALNLRGVDTAAVPRGTPLLTPDAWLLTSTIDVGVNHPVDSGDAVLHIGSAAVAVRVRPLGKHAARLTLSRELPLRIGDRALLRDPGRANSIAGVHVLDVRPPPLRRRGAAPARAAELAGGLPDAAAVLRRHGLLLRRELAAMGRPTTGQPVIGEWLADPAHWASLRERLTTLVENHERQHPLDGGLPLGAAQRALDLPASELVTALVQPPLRVHHGRLLAAEAVPEPVRRAVEQITAELHSTPFQAPDAGWLVRHGIDHRVLAAAARAGLLLRLSDGVVLLPGATETAAKRLAALPQPFTASDARTALDTTRRVAIPLLEHLDARGITRRIDDRRRETCAP